LSDHSHLSGHSYVHDAVRVTAPEDDAALAEAWDHIVVPPELKALLFNHALLAMELRRVGLGGASLPTHGLIVLSGPPGTGKTSLARGLGAKVAEHFGGRLGSVRVIDVNCHVLTSELLGRTQRNIIQLFQEELPSLAQSGPLVVVLDEMEALGVSRSRSSVEINPADVFRGTAALLSALDWVARELAGTVVVGTTNVPGALDDAVMSRADLVLSFPSLTVPVIQELLADTLVYLGGHFPACGLLAVDSALEDVAANLSGLDGRQVRKFILDALASEHETTVDPGRLSMETLICRSQAVAVAIPVASLALGGY